MPAGLVVSRICAELDDYYLRTAVGSAGWGDSRGWCCEIQGCRIGWAQERYRADNGRRATAFRVNSFCSADDGKTG
jgi:hypothetical protein